MNTLALAAIDHRGYAFRRELIKMAVPVSEMNPWITPRTAHIFSHLKTPLGEIARHLTMRPLPSVGAELKTFEGKRAPALTFEGLVVILPEHEARPS